MEIEREKSIFFDFKDVDFIPTEPEIHRWVMNKGVKEGDIYICDFHYHTKQAIIKFHQQPKLNDFLSNNPSPINFQKNNQSFPIPIIIPGKTSRKIKIRYVPDELNLDALHAALEQYGEVGDFEWEAPQPNPDIIPGVRRERIIFDVKLKKEIPSFIKVTGCRLAVTYQGQTKTCPRCNTETHEGSPCPRNYALALTDQAPKHVISNTIRQIGNILDQAKNSANPYPWQKANKRKGRSKKQKGTPLADNTMDISDADGEDDTDSQGPSSHSSDEADPSLKNASKRNKQQSTTPEKPEQTPRNKHSQVIKENPRSNIIQPSKLLYSSQNLTPNLEPYLSTQPTTPTNSTIITTTTQREPNPRSIFSPDEESIIDEILSHGTAEQEKESEERNTTNHEKEKEGEEGIEET